MFAPPCIAVAEPCPMYMWWPAVPLVFLIYTNAPSVPASPEAVKSLASQRTPAPSEVVWSPLTSSIFDLTFVTSKESVTDYDNATLNGPASVAAEDEFVVNVNEGFIVPILFVLNFNINDLSDRCSTS